MSQETKFELLPGYNVSIQGRHLQVTESMKDYILEKLAKIERFSHRLIDVAVTLEIQKLDHRVDIVLRFDHFKVKVQADSESMYAAIDKACDKLQAQVRRYKDKIQDHQARRREELDVNVNVYQRDEDIINDDIEDENAKREQQRFAVPKVVRKEKRSLKHLTNDEAIMKLDLSGDSFLIYKSEEDQKLKVIYRMSDQNFGVIEPE